MTPFKKAQVEVLARNLGVDYSAIQMKHRLIDAITTARTANGWSQSQLADELGETEEVISQMETKTRTRQISLVQLFEIAHLLGYTHEVTVTMPI